MEQNIHISIYGMAFANKCIRAALKHRLQGNPNRKNCLGLFSGPDQGGTVMQRFIVCRIGDILTATEFNWENLLYVTSHPICKYLYSTRAHNLEELLTTLKIINHNNDHGPVKAYARNYSRWDFAHIQALNMALFHADFNLCHAADWMGLSLQDFKTLLHVYNVNPTTGNPEMFKYCKSPGELRVYNQLTQKTMILKDGDHIDDTQYPFL